MERSKRWDDNAWADSEWYSKTIRIFDWVEFKGRPIDNQRATIFHEVCHLLVPDVRSMGHGKYWRELMIKCGLIPIAIIEGKETYYNYRKANEYQNKVHSV